MATLMQQLHLYNDAEGANGTDGLARSDSNSQDLQAHTQQELDLLQAQGRANQQVQLCQREREKLQTRERDQRDQECLQQLQQINNLLLLGLQPPSNFHQNRSSHDESCSSQSATENITDEADMSISDLFGLSMPRGSLLSSNQSTENSPGYRHYQCHGQSRNNSQGSTHQHHQKSCDDSHGYYSSTSTMDTPSSPTSGITPPCPSTPGSLYSNPYSYSSTASGSPRLHSTPSQSNRSGLQDIGSSPSPAHPPYHGRPIRGSPSSYSECSNSTWNSWDYLHTPGCTGSRSNSPADSGVGVSSMDGSLSDIMSCLSLSPSMHCHPQSLGSLMSPDIELCSSNKALQRMAAKKYLSQPHQNTIMHHHHSHNYNRGHHYNHTQPGFINMNFLNNNKTCCSGASSHVIPPVSSPTINYNNEPKTSLDRAARFHRKTAALCDATCTWEGTLPPRTQKPDSYSSKVFLGGVPWDITEQNLVSCFKHIGPIRVEWPRQDQSEQKRKGYVYIIFDSEKQVRALLACCTRNFNNGGTWHYKISSQRIKGKTAEVIPWGLSDSNYIKSSSQKLNPDKTVFVGGLHGMLTAAGLATIMDDLYDNVIYAGIDTDKFKYPIGSGRVTFSSTRSYKRAIAAAVIEVKAPKFTKKFQIDPYMEDAMCSSCSVQRGPYFCREEVCLRYFCRSCWHWQHSMGALRFHEPMSRDSNSGSVVGFLPYNNYNVNYRGLNDIPI
ncbi:cytoplasmic polyadenylation element-binding protein 1-A-like isoform X1 [Prorops nasuta]|uniref:cytoplasmic polyadenylation element-binding protein 1-A-like isoform X1 n=1 Tax=Prorops nasuta TaxID=863751 RepID=UPI0034CD5339